MQPIPVGTPCFISIKNPSLYDIYAETVKFDGAVCTVTGPMQHREMFAGGYYHPVSMSDGLAFFVARVALIPITPPPDTKIDDDVKHDELETV